jgi:dissimilatory sulfite reductase (desulfoviridin) alpha/beta subunit
VKLTEMAAEPLGLTFIGRGFDVKVSVPFSSEIEAGLQKVAAECVEQCPTGALVFAEKKLAANFSSSASCEHGRPATREQSPQPKEAI